MLVDEVHGQLVDGITRKRAGPGCGNRGCAHRHGGKHADYFRSSESFHFMSLTQRNPRLEVVSSASSDDSIATRISTA